MNGATEATLQELLQVNKSMAAAIGRLASQGGGSGGSSSGIGTVASAALAPLSIAANGVRAAFGALSDVVSGLVAVVGKLVGGVLTAASGLIDFAAAAAKGQATLSTVFSSFSKMPFFIGEVASMFAGIVAYGEKLLGSYRQITDSGANFGGDLIKMRLAAGRAGIDLDTFTTIIRENSDIFATAGQNVQSGVDFFVNVQNQLMGPNSRLQKNFTSLGYTAEQAATMTTTYIRMQGGLYKQELTNANTVADGVARMAQEVDLYAKVTGRSREAIEKEIRERSLDAAFQNQLQNLGENKLRAELALTDALQRGGKGTQDMLKSLILTQGEIAVVTDDAKKAYISSNGAAEDYAKNMYRLIFQSNLQGADLQYKFLQQARDLADGTKIFQDTFSQLQIVGNKYVTGQNELLTNQRNFQGKTNAQLASAVDKAKAAEIEQARSFAKKLADAEKMIKDFGNQIFVMVAQIIGPMLPELTKFATWIVSLAGSLAGKVAPLIGDFIKFFEEKIMPVMRKVGAWFGEQYDKLIKSKNAGDFFEQLVISIKEGFTNIWKEVEPVWNKEIKPVLIKVWEGVVEFLTPMFIKMFDKIVDSINAWLFSVVGERFGAVDPAKRQKQREQEYSFDDRVSQLKKELSDAAANDEATQRRIIEQIRIEQERLRVSIGGLYNRDIKADIGWRNATPAMPIDALKASGGQRDRGTSGMLGLNAEPKDTTVDIEKGERVLNPTETASYNNLGATLNQLNNLTAQLLMAQRESNDLARRTLSATKGLSTNLFA
jgi:hypothetical protein